jgi:hypothetical protein
VSLRYLPNWICRAVLAIAIFHASGLIAKADIGVVLADPTTVGVSVYTHAGHSLVYLSGVCAASPIRARLCEAGEQGSVVTTYPDFREKQTYAWNLVPLSLYLQGSMTSGDRLLYGSRRVKEALEAQAREGFFQDVCADGHCPQIPHSFWRDLVDANAVRDIFIFAVHTTRAQDQAAVDWLNGDTNVNHYNGFTNNCAVFTSSLVNQLFPHSVHRDLINDLGMMAPKAAVRSFTHWARKRPELGFYSMHFAQQPGDYPRSAVAQSGTETAIHMKKYLIPAALIGDHEVAGSFFVAYFFTGRFGVYKEFSHYASSLDGGSGLEQPEEENRDQIRWSYVGTDAEQKRSTVLGLPQDWADYKERFAEIENSAEAKEFAHKRFFPQQFDNGNVSVDAEGRPWLTMEIAGSMRRVGISNRNLMAVESDPELAFQLMLGRVGYVLRAKNHQRETMEEFRKDWSLLEEARSRLIFNQVRVKVASLQ